VLKETEEKNIVLINKKEGIREKNSAFDFVC
jgi:hypothetical protein